MDSTIRLRRLTALLGSAALLASMTVATVAAPASAVNCVPWTDQTVVNDGDCYYYDGLDINVAEMDGGEVTGGPDHDFVDTLSGGTFNGGGGNDGVRVIDNNFVGDGGTFNGGKGDDWVEALGVGTFNGGPGDDVVVGELYDGPFNGGPGDDCADVVYGGATYAGGGGSDTYRRDLDGLIWSAVQAGPCPDVTP